MINIRLTLQWSGDPPLSRPGRWAYPDMLEVGNLDTPQEDRAHFGLWCIVSSPLILGLNLTNETLVDKVWDIVTNTEAIAVNQAWFGHPGTRVRQWDDFELWAKPVSARGAVAALAVSLADPTAEAKAATIDLAWLGINGTAAVRDIWAHLNNGTRHGSLTTDALQGHDSRFYLFTPQEAAGAPLLAAPGCEEQCRRLSMCPMVDDGKPYEKCNAGCWKKDGCDHCVGADSTGCDGLLSCEQGCVVARASASLEQCTALCASAHCDFSVGNRTWDLCQECPTRDGHKCYVSRSECRQACIIVFGCPGEPPMPPFANRSF